MRRWVYWHISRFAGWVADEALERYLLLAPEPERADPEDVVNTAFHMQFASDLREMAMRSESRLRSRLSQ